MSDTQSLLDNFRYDIPLHLILKLISNNAIKFKFEGRGASGGLQLSEAKVFNENF